MYKIILPKNAVGNYWLSDKSKEYEKKLVNIEGKEGLWQVRSSNYVKILDSNFVDCYDRKVRLFQKQEKIINKVILKEYSTHYVYLKAFDDVFILYCSPVYETNLLHLDIKNTQEILIGKSTNNHITYNNKLVKDIHAKIYLNNGRWMIENFDYRFGTFVNNSPIIQDTKILFNGDIIFIMGLKIILMGNSIFINNPLNKVKYNDKKLILNKTKNTILNQKKDENNNPEIYQDEEYFSRAPRITGMVECEKVKIDAPPIIQSKDEMPIIYVLGSMLSMGVIMMVSIVMSIDGLLNGTATAKETIFALIMAFAMLISIILFPILNVRYERKRKKKYEEKRQKRYKEYINSKIKLIDKIMINQRKILFDNYVSAEECTKIILERTSRLWERKIEEHDFLTVRLGIGDVPLNIDIQYPEKQFSMEDDNLVEILDNIANKSKILKSAPIVLSLIEKNISSIIVGNEDTLEKFMQNLFLQLIAFHSYEDLKIVFVRPAKGK